MSKKYTACFFGHRKIVLSDRLKTILCEETEKLITISGINTFLFGSKSQFNDLCYKIVSELKTKYPDIKRIYVRAESEFIEGEGSPAYRERLMELYEDTYFPESASSAGKAVYIKRNQHMIDKSSVCVVYYDTNYAPSEKNHRKRDLFDYQPASGTGIAYKYAEKKKRRIINIFRML